MTIEMNDGVEVWHPIEGFSAYEVSSLARVRSGRTGSLRLLSGTITAVGYTAFILRRDSDGKKCRRLLHRLVAFAFVPTQGPAANDVCHNDGNPGNNAPENLRWDTHRNNQMDMRKHGTMQDGEKCVTAVLSEQQMREIRAATRTEGRGAGRRMSKKFGISPAQVSRIKTGTRWAASDEVAA